jgi:amino acid transporter
MVAEMESGNRLRRVLGPISLTALGVGAIIGTGIFVLVGKVAANQAGPAIMLSFVVAGLACVFAAFCYAEFASMAPVAGSAYNYAYATLGELMAWIIGWDLILEYRSLHRGSRMVQVFSKVARTVQRRLFAAGSWLSFSDLRLIIIFRLN